MDFDNATTIGSLSSLPQPAKKPEESKWNGWSAVLRGPVAGASSLIAGGVEAATGTARALGQMRDGVPFEQYKWDDESEVSRSLRSVREFYRPDPATASTAENVVFEAGAFLTQLVPSVLAAGPVGGAAIVGASEMARTSGELQAQGVDPETARRAGFVAGGISAGGAVLPLAGSTAARTVGLYAVGGPGSFVAQQALTRDILERANYADLAKQYDPLDPTGLAVSSLVPLPFAAWGLRGNLKAKAKGAEPPKVEPAAVPRETVDAAMVHNLTLVRDAQDAKPPAAHAAELWRVPVTENPNFKAWFGDSQIKTADGAPMVVYHGTGRQFDAFDKGALGDNTQVADAREGFFFTSSGADASEYAWRDGERGSVLPVYLSMKNPFVSDMVVTAANNREFAAVIREAKAAGHDGVAAFLDTFGRESSVYVVFEPTQIKSAIGNSGLFDPTSASLTDPIPQVKPPKVAPEVTAAKEAAAQLKASGKPVESFVQDTKLPDAVRNLVIGMGEGDQARADSILADFARAVDQQPGRSAVDISADVVEAARAGKTLTPEPMAPDVNPEQAAAQSMATRVAEVEGQNPDLLVGQDENGNPVTARELMERARREAAEGTDTELGANDADLLRVAADCALSLGD